MLPTSGWCRVNSENGSLEPIDYSVFSEEILRSWPEELQLKYGMSWARLANAVCYDWDDPGAAASDGLALVATDHGVSLR